MGVGIRSKPSTSCHLGRFTTVRVGDGTGRTSMNLSRAVTESDFVLDADSDLEPLRVGYRPSLALVRNRHFMTRPQHVRNVVQSLDELVENQRDGNVAGCLPQTVEFTESLLDGFKVLPIALALHPRELFFQLADACVAFLVR